MEARDYPKVEEVLRLLASAVNAARLYPPSSDLPQQALDRLVTRTNEVTGELGTVRLLVDPHAFRMGETQLSTSHSQTVGLAESLHAMQVGQLVIAPGLQSAEAAAFLSVAGRDPREVRAAGGPRSALTAAGASTIAVIEVSLRSSTEAGLLGVDLINAPLEEVAQETLAATARWYAAAGTEGAFDEAARAIGQLEQATRDLASSRIADAMMRLSEDERVRILLSAMTADAAKRPMRGMLDVIARMSPATIARLLRMASTQCGVKPEMLAMPLELPPEAARELAAFLAPSPRTEAECGVPADPAVERMAVEALAPGGEADLEQLKNEAGQTRAGKALVTTIAVVRNHADADSIRALGEALAPAAQSGALSTVREALRTIDALAANPVLAGEAEMARTALADPEVLAEVCRRVSTDADAAIAGELLSSTGRTGANVLLSHYARAGSASRSLLRPVLRGMSEQVVSVASRRLRSDDSATAIGILSALPDLGEQQVLLVVTAALEHLDVEVRHRAVTTLADINGPESRRALAKALGHWDPETRRWAIREVGRVQATEAIPSLVRILEDINVLERNHELKKEVIKCLESVGSRDAVPVLDRWSKRRFLIGRKNKELRFLARRAVERLAAKGEPEKESMPRD
ncbi:MAG: HEAT repeat domain-containing protein [Coriobacteriia bacterium]|nr:HEAT repeat domain-containing protein [Coriobacteriia bacterium]